MKIHALRRATVLAGLVLAALIGLAACSKPQAETRKIKFYQSPMHPWITSDKPGNCTICGMKLVPVYEGDEPKAQDPSVLTLSAASQDVLGVSTVPVRKLALTKTLRFTGILEDDENLHRVIAAFYDGRIEQIQVDHVGEYIEKGRPMASIYSPDLLYVVREYQNALRGGDQGVARNSARRLVQYGLTPEQVVAIAKLPEDVYTVDLLAPISGTVVTKKAYRGQYIKTGEPLFEMGDLSHLWFHAEVYERDLPDIRLGQKAVVRTPTVPGRDFPGEVTFIDPNFDEKTRTTKVRIVVDNPVAEGQEHPLRRLLPHRAYAEADLVANLGEVLVAPRSALLRDGRRSVVYVETGPNRYDQRSVQVGRTGDEGVEILSGLKEGDKVVTEGNLMIDAEAQLRQGTDVETSIASSPALPPQKEADAFLAELARVSDALASDDSVAAIKAGQNLKTLADAIPAGIGPRFDAAVAQLKAVPSVPAGGDLKAVRQSFLPWSVAGANLALAMAAGGQGGARHVFECPMTSGSFPGAPPKAQWVQAAAAARNPYLGAEMLTCGFEVKP